MNLLIVDVETTGLDPKKDALLEIGFILFSVEHRMPVCSGAFVFPCESNPVEHINKITAALNEAAGISFPSCWVETFRYCASLADFVVAHNAKFDSKWLPELSEKTWLCTMEDFRWPEEMGLKGRFSLSALALAHGIPVWAQHRALTDCTYIAQVFEKTEGLAEAIKVACQPKSLYVSLEPFSEKEKVKEAGFTWNEPVAKQWSRFCTEAERTELSRTIRMRKHA
jgi:DNA polymerase-3 subunit epsilon